MRAKAEELLGENPNFVSVVGTAEQTTLPDHSFHLVTAAAAFHWFDPEFFRLECERILLPGAPVVLAWNEAGLSAEINLGRERIFKKYCPNSKASAEGKTPGIAPNALFWERRFKSGASQTLLSMTVRPSSIAPYQPHIL